MRRKDEVRHMTFVKCYCGASLRGPRPKSFDWVRTRTCRRCNRRWKIVQVAFHDPECIETRPCYDLTHLMTQKSWKELT